MIPSLSGIVDYVLREGKHIVIIVGVYLLSKHSASGKVSKAAISLIIISLVWYVIGDVRTVLDAIGKVFGR